MLTSADMDMNTTDLKDQYEAPAIELVLSSADLERQVHYAGVIISCPGGDCAPPPGAHHGKH